MKEWQTKLSECRRSIHEMKDLLNLTEEEIRRIADIEERYPVCVPDYYLGLINPEDRDDPIRRMCVPDSMEFSEGGSPDTSGEADNTVVQGMQHKYRQTALILSTNQCAMYCRHCFRKRLVGLSSEEIAEKLPEMVDYAREHPEISNVLISGGDAFLCSNEMIKRYLEAFTSIPSISFIRFGTRVPVTFPFRITEDDGELAGILREYGKRKHIIVVTQFNHPHEITPESLHAVDMLRGAGCTVRNQTVLLRGVNDDPEVLADLMNGLTAAGVMPYYVFQCRPVEGVLSQFQVPLLRGSELIEEAKATMSGPAKAFRYAMSHPTGKIEILGRDGDSMLFRYHQAKNGRDRGRIFHRPVSETECWFDEP